MLGALLMKNNLCDVCWAMKHFESLHVMLDYTDNKMKELVLDFHARQ